MAGLYITIWQRLGIEPTSNIKQIKRAYAKQLQVYHPEEDAAGYQALREAYDHALKIAKQQNDRIKQEGAASSNYNGPLQDEQIQRSGQDTEYVGQHDEQDNEQNAEQSDEQSDEQSAEQYDDEQHDDEHHLEHQTELHNEPNRGEEQPQFVYKIISDEVDQTADSTSIMYPRLTRDGTLDAEATDEGIQTVDEFIEQAIAIYEHFPSRISSDAWLELLNSSVTWNMNNKEEISGRLLDLLQERKYLPGPIWKLLDHFFKWEHELTEANDGESGKEANSFLDYYKKQLHSPGLRYEFLLQAGDIDYDMFLKYRYEGYQALMENRLEKASAALYKALKLFADDPDLLRLIGEYNVRMCRFDEAIAVFDQLIDVIPGEADGYLNRARIRYAQREFALAAEEYKSVAARFPSNIEAVLMLGKCSLELGQREEAIGYFIEVHTRTEPASPEAIQALNSLADIQPDYVQKLYEQQRQAVKRHNTTKWLQLIRPKTIISLWIVFFLVLILVGFVNSIPKEIEARKPLVITSVEQLARADHDHSISITLTDVTDLDLGQYELENESGIVETVYDSRYNVYMKFRKFGLPLPKRYIYLGKFHDQHIIFFTRESLDKAVIEEQQPFTMTGTLEELRSTSLRRTVASVLRELMPNDEVPVGYYPKYINEGKPPKTITINISIVVFVGLAVIILTRCLLFLYKEFGRVRRLDSIHSGKE